MSDPGLGQLPSIFDVNVGTREWLAALVADYPPHPEYGIDYTDVVDCPIVTCLVRHGDKLLLVERGSHVLEYRNTWATIGGFLPRREPAEVILEELLEEVGIQTHDIETLTIARRRLRLDPAMRVGDELLAMYRKRWHEFRSMAVLAREVEPVTNWENRAAKWVHVSEVAGLPLLPSSRRTTLAWLRKLTAA